MYRLEMLANNMRQKGVLYVHRLERRPCAPCSVGWESSGWGWRSAQRQIPANVVAYGQYLGLDLRSMRSHKQALRGEMLRELHVLTTLAMGWTVDEREQAWMQGGHQGAVLEVRGDGGLSQLSTEEIEGGSGFQTHDDEEEWTVKRWWRPGSLH